MDWQKIAENRYTLWLDATSHYKELETQIEQQAALLAEAREALEAVEWVTINGTDYCAWCSYPYQPPFDTENVHIEYPSHAPDCQRQAVLAKLGQP